ncbi:MAG TPA: sulfurtransferase TusA family protein [Solirubrobacteraceae bacterium]|nr:sulfurtransferase TusA family protein [Solirubrobacteraceae bacterium]
MRLARFEEGRDHALIVRTLDARGLACPLPLLHARRELPSLAAGDTLIVLATDPEAPIDLAAFAADEGLAFASEALDGEWRIALSIVAAGGG